MTINTAKGILRALKVLLVVSVAAFLLPIVLSVLGLGEALRIALEGPNCDLACGYGVMLVGFISLPATILLGIAAYAMDDIVTKKEKEAAGIATAAPSSNRQTLYLGILIAFLIALFFLFSRYVSF